MSSRSSPGDPRRDPRTGVINRDSGNVARSSIVSIPVGCAMEALSEEPLTSSETTFDKRCKDGLVETTRQVPGAAGSIASAV